MIANFGPIPFIQRTCELCKTTFCVETRDNVADDDALCGPCLDSCEAVVASYAPEDLDCAELTAELDKWAAERSAPPNTIAREDSDGVATTLADDYSWELDSAFDAACAAMEPESSSYSAEWQFDRNFHIAKEGFEQLAKERYGTDPNIVMGAREYDEFIRQCLPTFLSSYGEENFYDYFAHKAIEWHDSWNVPFGLLYDPITLKPASREVWEQRIMKTDGNQQQPPSLVHPDSLLNSPVTGPTELSDAAQWLKERVPTPMTPREKTGSSPSTTTLKRTHRVCTRSQTSGKNTNELQSISCGNEKSEKAEPDISKDSFALANVTASSLSKPSSTISEVNGAQPTSSQCEELSNKPKRMYRKRLAQTQLTPESLLEVLDQAVKETATKWERLSKDLETVRQSLNSYRLIPKTTSSFLRGSDEQSW